ncbi:MAG TPA: protein kinase [Candidatus Eisenbacteria bacterium]|nr:protein kinase [Candidatus Eisenbacteria bacterium]
MALAAGSRIAHYEVLAALGAGGMGEVYRARDTRLDRTVALKSLPAAFATDPERLARFEREAKLLASLAHPNIAAIFGLEESRGAPYLVLEFVDGESLSQCLARGPLSARETIDIGVQIAQAIEAAHERGIVHRDLKPGNVMISAAGKVKVLDFGLAKGGAADATSEPNFSVTPTVALSATGDGIILGTAPYMSPEQARGRGVDRRADVWAFGCILYECLTGRQTFAGETVSDVIARILERDPDWSAMPSSTPARLRELVVRCLTKEMAARPRDIGDLRLELVAIGQEMSGSGISSSGIRAATAPSLAVLYFENLASDKESEYFCAGITEDILTDLSKIKGLKVASRNAVARYRGASVDIPKVASELGVQAVLEGSVRRAGDRVRISAQLINAADGFHLWAERYDRTLQDVFAVQEEIASSIAEALRVALSPAESENLVKDRPNDVRAYDLYLKGRAAYSSYNAKSLREALELFKQATAIEPTYALAWAGIADCYGQMNQWGGAEKGWDIHQLGVEAANRAVELNPRLPEAYKAQALVLRFADQRDAARVALLKALELNPRFTPALLNLAVDAYALSDVAGAERFVRRAIECDPQEMFAQGWLCVILTQTNRGDEAITVAKRQSTLTDSPFYISWSYANRAWIALTRHDSAAAEGVLAEARGAGVPASRLTPFEALIAARAGDIERAARLLPANADSQPDMGAIALVILAATAIRLGEHDRAIQFMNRPLIADLAPTLARLDPELHPLLDRPPLAPRRLDGALVWPLEAPMIDAACHALFREVRIESGLPPASAPSTGR